MKKLMIGLLTLASLSSEASMIEVNGPMDEALLDSQVNEDKTHYQKLADLFANGTRPDPAKISGVLWAGRCFAESKPNKAIGAGLIMTEKSNDAGPIGTNSKHFSILTFLSLRERPDHYDNYTMDQIYTEVRHLERSEIVMKSSSLNYSVDLNRNIGTWNLRKSGKYLVESAVEREKETGRIIIKGMCYFFIPGIKE